MKKWNLMVDIGRCHNSNNCFLAVVDEYGGNEHPGYSAAMPLHGHRWLDIEIKERGQAPMVEANYRPVTCNHCDDAPCIKAAQNGAVTKRDDGIVIIDPEKAKGQKQLVDSCPYGAIWWNEEKQVPQHWPFDAHLLDRGWAEPRCVTVCPTGALRSVKIEDDEMAKLAEKEQLEVLHPEYGTRPRVWYKNMHLAEKCFIGGTVVAQKDGVEDCVAGATAIVKKDGAAVGEAVTDAFGEFKVDRLDKGSGTYEVEISHPDHGSARATADLGDSVYLGVIALST
jgi:Fe-S-cluster-containing dehydrogenase component